MPVWLLFDMLYSDLGTVYYSCRGVALDLDGVWDNKLVYLLDLEC